MSDKKITIEFDADLVERHSLVKDRMYFLKVTYEGEGSIRLFIKNLL